MRAANIQLSIANCRLRSINCRLSIVDCRIPSSLDRLQGQPTLRRTPRSAFTMIEAVVSIVLVSGLLVATLNAVGASALGQKRVGDRTRAQLMALDLMAEVREQEYQDPNETPTFGLEPLDAGPGRTGYDDVDDYRSYAASPPQHRDGTTYSDLTGWTQQVVVARVNALTPSTPQVPGIETGVKRITVTIKKGSATLASIVALRAQTCPITSSGGMQQNPW